MNQVEQSVAEYVDEVWEDVVADIEQLVSYPSVAVAADAEPSAPFGRPVRDALDCALGIAQKLGYQTSDDEAMWHCRYPGSRRQAARDHLPRGRGARRPRLEHRPFAMERREGWLLGRGVIDDKGPAVLSLYAGAYLLKHGIVPRYTFRALLGCDEEVGMSDVHHYLENHADPDFLFTPDAEFPVCNAEKGQFGATFVSPKIDGGRIVSWSGAEASNAIPSQSICELAIAADELPAPIENADRLEITALENGHAQIFAHGIGGHASMPEGTINAVGLIVTYLREAEDAFGARDERLLTPAEHEFVKFLAFVHADAYGRGLGIDATSSAFGPLTCNAGVIRVADGHIEQVIDVRFPDSTSADTIREQLDPLVGRFGVTCQLGRAKVPFSVSADDPAVKALIDTYNELRVSMPSPLPWAAARTRATLPAPCHLAPRRPAWSCPHGAARCMAPTSAPTRNSSSKRSRSILLRS